MAEQAVVKPSVPYVSQDPEADMKRFRDTLRRVVSVPKAVVEKSIAEESDHKRKREEKSS